MFTRREFISKAGIITGGLFLPEKIISSPYAKIYPIIPSEQAFRVAVGGTWTAASVFSYNATNNITISRKVFNGNQLSFTGNCDNILIEYCIFKNLAELRQISASGSNIVHIHHCYFENVGSGIYLDADVNQTGNSGYNIHHNVFKNMTGFHKDFLGQSIQFNNITAAANGSDIAYNYCYYKIADGGDPEDIINIHNCKFTSGDPLNIHHNYIWGPGESSTGVSTSGGGILVSDNACEYVKGHHNIVMYPGQYGIGNASGIGCEISNNKVYQTSQPWSNVGIYTYDAYHTGACANNSVLNNNVNYKNAGGSNNGSYIPSGSDPGCGTTTNTGNNFSDSSITDQEIPDPQTLWWAPRHKNKISLL